MYGALRAFMKIQYTPTVVCISQNWERRENFAYKIYYAPGASSKLSILRLQNWEPGKWIA